MRPSACCRFGGCAATSSSPPPWVPSPWTCTGVVAVDVGAAAGGFTTALLRAGARRVYAVDTGYGQLRARLRADPRVACLERTNVDALGPQLVPGVVDLVTMDLSYTSIAAAVRPLGALHLATGARLIALVKPTFELAAGTVVLDRPRVEAAIAMACGAIEAAGWRCDAITLPSRQVAATARSRRSSWRACEPVPVGSARCRRRT